MIYETIYKRLIKLIDFEKLQAEGHLKYKAKGFMDLNLDFLDSVGTESFTFSMAHNYIQNGDVMADPDMVISVYPAQQMAEALTFQQDGLGIFQQVYTYEPDGRKLGVFPALKKSMNSFLLTWLNNIKKQGHALIKTSKQLTE